MTISRVTFEWFAIGFLNLAASFVQYSIQRLLGWVLRRVSILRIFLEIGDLFHLNSKRLSLSIL